MLLLFQLIPQEFRDVGLFLEVGSSWGKRTAAIEQMLGMKSIGVDPSRKATDAGNKMFQDRVQLKVGTAQSIPVEDHSVAVAFYGFCLYLVPPSRLDKAMEELQRVTQNEHYVAILDFDFPNARPVPYAHLDGLYSYRHSYEDLMSRAGYSLVAKIPLVAGGGIELAADPMNRVAAWLFEKSPPQVPVAS